MFGGNHYGDSGMYLKTILPYIRITLAHWHNKLSVTVTIIIIIDRKVHNCTGIISRRSLKM